MENLKENDQVPEISFIFEEGGRGCRTKKRHLDPTCCPVCSVTLRETEMDTHLHVELDKLNKLPISKMKVNGKCTPSCSNSSPSDNTSDTDKNWETFQKVKNNRQNRLRTKTRKRKAEEQLCPICNKDVIEDLQTHVEFCLRRSEENDFEHEEENVDIESFEEYEWAGQSRIRATSLLPGGVSSLGQSLQNVNNEDEDLNVDGFGELYGSPQYSERDIILPSEESTQDLALRKAVIGDELNFPVIAGKDTINKASDNTDSSCSGDPVLEALKNRIKELEERIECKDEIYKCLICMDRYQTPVISICCWHVHCEQCWLRTLGAKKLCPQCNMITSPADLRKIFM
ncbi:unnamed protein product [Ceutorhynchus assimilis]|uniref:RING-type domain-containing protein n=1 Tax=Ceutorhynchus assimilis TaxID=467358 RepID=A0A9N9MED7_9CUCU|nr:unnamed protein product [Ceutorhynchus assimilis]